MSEPDPSNPYDTVIVTGGRKQPWFRILWVLDQLNPRRVVEGGCRTGADAAARQWLFQRGIPTRSYPIPKDEWTRYGLGAGPRRNGIMLRDWTWARVLAFPDEEGSGTQDCIRQAWGLGMWVEIYTHVEVLPDPVICRRRRR